MPCWARANWATAVLWANPAKATIEAPTRAKVRRFMFRLLMRSLVYGPGSRPRGPGNFFGATRSPGDFGSLSSAAANAGAASCAGSDHPGRLAGRSAGKGANGPGIWRYALFGGLFGGRGVEGFEFRFACRGLGIVAAAGIGLVPSLVQLLEALHCLAPSVGIVERRFRDRGEAVTGLGQHAFACGVAALHCQRLTQHAHRDIAVLRFAITIPPKPGGERQTLAQDGLALGRAFHQDQD